MQIKLLLFLFITLIFNSCDSSTGVGTTNNFVKLQDQSDHSGIIIKIMGTNQFVVTDIIGKFELPPMPDGKYNLEIKYPYFQTQRIEINFENNKQENYVNIELKKLFQFWVEPNDTVISLSKFKDRELIELNFLRQYTLNVSNAPVLFKRTLEPQNLICLFPINNPWPFIPNEDGRSEFCYENYGWFGSNDLITKNSIVIQPKETTSVAFNLFITDKNCLREGDYYVFSAPSDQYNYREYFEAAYFWNDSILIPQSYNELNKTLLKKIELFRPALIHFTK